MENTSPAIIYKYFKELTAIQKEQIDRLQDLYAFWNAQINVISRKDIDSLYERHVLHSLAIAKLVSFKAGATILDVGTGGGFPGIPLAILFPQTQFLLVDSIGKKIKVVKEVANALGLTNIQTSHSRAEQTPGKFDFVISRAVTRLGEFYPWVRNKFKKDSLHAFPNGILYLKGGDLTEEIAESKLHTELFPIADFFDEEFFETKYVVYIEG
ncbi:MULTISPECIES: 16S rRNA (guanine(527)-N(7))-methyltransferase RsmG [Olivibacter]|jgi:16S rRNA (guanine527-N7)-methyltransferase|uniref:Ribosomal RNA small subunit methyltransferase G n=2 Tax=Sphingobacteriaceae TaxID=84566 RepID=F4CEX3_SPHS2|nr:MULTISPECIES: 16S rRNA (guanine(527)-N(7))-methyltransferase RsmG [Olivibacter]QEL01062.1 16S rRNA (guanine(527)-N(7))-methyltransferase RsmG [Olivibacter sp. LS-1]